MDAPRAGLLVIGHKNPDTDSVCSAIAYAAYKSDVGAERAEAFRAGNLNEQTRFVLSHFGIESPPLLTDVYPRIGDIMIPGVVHDEHSQNTYLFANGFTAESVSDHLVYGTVLDNNSLWRTFEARA